MIQFLEDGSKKENVSPYEAAQRIARFLNRQGNKKNEIHVEINEKEILFLVDEGDNHQLSVECKTDYLLVLAYLKECFDIEFYEANDFQNLPLIAL